MLLQTIRHRDGAGWSTPWRDDLDSSRTLAVMFGGSATAAARSAVAEVAARLPRSILMGCSSAGEICADQVQDGGLMVAIARFDEVTLRKAALPISDPLQSRAVGQQLATMLATPDLRAVFVLSDGLRVNGSQLAAGMNARTILGIDEAAQSLTFAGDVPEGHRARLMRTSTERLIQSAEVAARDAAIAFPATASPLAIAISCVGRRLVLGERTDEEIESVLDALPSGTGQVGFYSYGEMSPAIAGGGCDLHNQTMTVTLLDERPKSS